MLPPSPHPFACPAHRAPRHGLMLAAAAIGTILAGAALFLPVTDEALAHAVPIGIGLLVALLGGLLARLGRDDA